MEKVLKGRALVPGRAEGQAVVSGEPLSLWGGLCPRTGEIIDRRHELSGRVVSGKVLVFPAGRGSSTSSATLAEAVRAGVAPAAIINRAVDPILVLGSIIAEELYHRAVPIVLLAGRDFSVIGHDDRVTVEPDGTVTVRSDPSQ